MSDNKHKFIEFTYCGGLQLEKVMIDLNSIISIEKPISNKVGCIIQTIPEKFPVKETYEEVIELLNKQNI